MKINQLKKKYKNEWILVEVLKEDELNNPIEIKIVSHSKDRDKIYDFLLKVKPGKHVATLYTGEIPRKGYAVALDTGATFVMIPWRIAESLDLKPEIAQEKIYITTASGTEKAPLVLLKLVKVLGKESREIKAVVHDLPTASYVDGLLGLSFMNKFKWILDFKKGFLEIE